MSLMFPKPEKKTRGQKGLLWRVTRTRLIQKFTDAGITRCELCYGGCAGNQMLSFAHTLKRRYIITQQQLERVVLACIPCHNKVEYDPNMEEILEKVIAARRRQP